MSRLLSILAPIAFLAALLAIWQATCTALAIPPYLLPTPSEIVVAGLQNLPLLATSAWNTLSTALLALATASVAACLLALAVSLHPLIEQAVRPIVTTWQVTPVIAIAPLVTIWAGLDHPERAILVLAVIVAFFPIFSGALTGLKSADADLERLFDLYGASDLQRFLQVMLPGLAPALISGVALAFARAVGEYGSVIFIAGNMPMVSEIAPLMIVTRLEQYDYAGAAAVGLVMVLISFGALALVNALQMRLARVGRA